MTRFLLMVANRMSISDRLCLVAYMGGPLQAALPFRYRILARLIGVWRRFRPLAIGGSEL